MLPKTSILTEHFIGGDLHFTFALVPQPGPPHLYFPVRQLHAARLRSMVADLATAFTWGAWTRQLFGAQEQNLFQRLMPNFINHGLHDLAGVLDQVDDREQDLPVGLAELLDDG